MTMSSLTRREVLALGVTLGAGTLVPSRLRGMQGEAAKAAFDWTLHQPEDVGMSRAGLDGIRAAIQKHIDANEWTGAVTAVARHNKLVWYEAQGVRDVATGAPMRKDDIFYMASSTKMVTATAVLMMMDAGRLSLDDKVRRFIPTFKDPKVAVAPPGAKQASDVKIVPANREITIRDLLTHTSGLSSLGDGLAPGPASLVNTITRGKDDTLADYVPRLGAAVLDFQPGTKWRYSASDGFDVLLRLVEITSGAPADVFLRERIFEPLDMHDTHFNVPAEKKDRILTLYAREKGEWRPQTPLAGYGPSKYIWGAGGLLSTVHDFMQFEAMLLNKGTLNGRRLLKPETVALMSRNHVGTLFAEWIPIVTAGHGFGLGVAIVEDPKASHRGVGAFGWGGAYGTESWANPALGIAAAMFVQQPVRPAKTDFERAVREAVVA